jgi:Holliday junction resolvase RusA-like endonuclease
MTFEAELPYPPSVNHYWRRVGPRTLIGREGRRFRERVLAILAARPVATLTGPRAVERQVFPPDRRRRDLDNLQKAVLDALQHSGVYGDDSQVVRLLAEKCAPVAGGKPIVRIRNT